MFKIAGIPDQTSEPKWQGGDDQEVHRVHEGGGHWLGEDCGKNWGRIWTGKKRREEPRIIQFSLKENLLFFCISQDI